MAIASAMHLDHSLQNRRSTLRAKPELEACQGLKSTSALLDAN
jgi:hypothetical protein